MFYHTSIILKTNRKRLNIIVENSLLPNLRELVTMILTFELTVFAWSFSE